MSTRCRESCGLCTRGKVLQFIIREVVAKYFMDMEKAKSFTFLPFNIIFVFPSFFQYCLCVSFLFFNRSWCFLPFFQYLFVFPFHLSIYLCDSFLSFNRSWCFLPFFQYILVFPSHLSIYLCVSFLSFNISLCFLHFFQYIFVVPSFLRIYLCKKRLNGAISRNNRKRGGPVSVVGRAR